MILIKLTIDNIYGFSGTEIDFSYKRKTPKSTIPNEFLPDRPKFNFKRICIISGTNASGKTSLGKVICGVENFIARKTLVKYLEQAICDRDKPASISVEFVTPSDNKFHSLFFTFDNSIPTLRNLKYACIDIGVNDSCAAVRAKMKKLKETSKEKQNTSSNYFIDSDKSGILQAIDEFSEINFRDLSWMFMFSENSQSEDKANSIHHISEQLIFKILNCFDSSIDSVEAVVPHSKTKSKKSKNNDDIAGYIIKFHNQDTVLINTSGEITGEKEQANRFSKGTFDAIKLTNFIGRVITDGYSKQSSTHFLDEQMAYTHSHLEQHILNLIIEKLSPTAQFFYTTHNYDILDMGLPSHSFLFMRKQGNYTSVVQPEMIFNKNDRSLINYVKNDYFCTLPNTSNLDALTRED